MNSKYLKQMRAAKAACSLTLICAYTGADAQKRGKEEGWQTAPSVDSRQLRERTPFAPAPRVAIAPVSVPFRPVMARTEHMKGVRNALWVVADTLASPQSIRTLVADAAEGGFDTLFVQVRARGDAYYFSAHEPRAEALGRAGEDYDPLALVIDEAHARGLKVHAWLNTFVAWGKATLPLSPDHVVNRHPEWIARDKNNEYARVATKTIEGAYLQPSNPEVQEHLYQVFTEVARKYGVDGIHFDYCRYANSEYDYSAGTLKRFRNAMRDKLSMDEVARIDREERANRLAWTNAFPAEWEAWRRDQVTKLVARISAKVRSLRNIAVSAAVYPDAQEAARYKGQEWEKWLSAGYLDMAALMAYSGNAERIGRVTAQAVSLANGKTILTGLPAYSRSVPEMRGLIRSALQSGANGIAFFAYNRLNATPENLKTLAREIGMEPRESSPAPESDVEYGSVPRKPGEEEVFYIQPQEEKPPRPRRKYRRR